MATREINELARRQIRAGAQQALRAAGVAGVIPTPLDAVARSAGVTEIVDIAHLPTGLVAKRPSLLRRVVGAIFYRERVVFVDRSQGVPRGRFIEAHEVSHKIIPWHEAIFRLDDKERIFGPTKRTLDIEADIGAAELLFQGDLFVRQALDYRVSMAAPFSLAPDFGVSLTAAIRHYAVDHPDPVAVAIGGRYLRANGAVPLWAAHESPSFRARIGPARQFFASGIPARDLGDDGAGAVVEQALRFGDVATGELSITDLRGDDQPFTLEAFCNQHVVMVMLSPVAGRFQGRRIRVASEEPPAGNRIVR